MPRKLGRLSQPTAPGDVPRYLRIVERLAGAFPPPGVDPAHNRRFVASLHALLGQVDAIKTAGPRLGAAHAERFTPEQIIAERVPPEGLVLDALLPRLVAALDGLTVWNHPQAQTNVAPCPTTASALASLLALLYNPNLVSAENAGGVADVELAVTAMVADLVGFDPCQARGVFTWGGAGGMLYALKIGLEKALPGSAARGLQGPAVVIASAQSHLSAQDAAAWLGVGRDNVLLAPTLDDFSVSVPAMEALARQAIAGGRRIAALVATLGSTDAFALDDLAAISAMRNRLVSELRLDYRPHLHADAVIGWAWTMFHEDDFRENALGFPARTLAALAEIHGKIKHLGRADTIGVDFHKTGYAPYVSSLLLAGDGADFELLARPTDEAPYRSEPAGPHPGRWTLETSRSGAGPLAAWASLLHLGRAGYRALLGHAVDMSERLRQRVAERPGMTSLDTGSGGPVTLVRVYPEGIAAGAAWQEERRGSRQPEEHNPFNRRVFERLRERAGARRGAALSLTSVRLGQESQPIVALKSFVLSPFVAAAAMDAIVDELDAARRHVFESSSPITER